MTDEPGRVRSLDSVRREREQSLVDRYGGFYWGSDFIGFAVAIFFTVVFFGIVGAIVGSVGYQLHAPIPKDVGTVSQTTKTLGIGGLVGGLIALFLAYVIGGYTAGRMARFEGIKNGIGVVIWTAIVLLILGVLGAVFGTKFNVASQLNLKIDTGTLTAGGAVSLLVALVVMFVGAILGGRFGANYHRKIDREVSGVA